MTDHPIVDGLITFGPGSSIRTTRLGPPEPSMSVEECVAHGGHCHDRTGMERPSSPPQYQERCRHCGHVRWAIPQDQYRYVEG